MGRLLDWFEVPDRRNQEAVEAMLSKLAEMDALIDEVAFLRCENAHLKALVERYEGDDGK